MRMEGIVKRNSMEKTVVVEVSRRRPHPRYGRMMTRLTKVYAHTEAQIPVGARVVVEDAKPISKLKRWAVVQIIKDNKDN